MQWWQIVGLSLGIADNEYKDKSLHINGRKFDRGSMLRRKVRINRRNSEVAGRNANKAPIENIDGGFVLSLVRRYG